MPDLIPFHFDTQEVRVVTHDDGSAWWVAADVCAILGLVNVGDALSRLEEGEKEHIVNPDAFHKELKMALVNEPGLYRLIFRSNKPEAKRFQSWVFTEVLPQIRRTGRYAPSAPGEADLAPWDMLIKMAEQGKEQARRILLIETEQATQRDTLIAVQAQTITTLERANHALATLQAVQDDQAWVTIHQYLVQGDLQDKLSALEQQAFGRYLTQRCVEKGLRVYPVPVAGQRWPQESTYCRSVLAEVLPQWLAQRYAQPALAVVPGGATDAR